MRVLIVYATRYGSTREMVEKLAANIHGTVEAVNVREQKIPNLESYQVILIGGPVYGRRIPVAIRRFCDLRHTQLASRKVGLFLSCLARWERGVQYMEKNFPRWIRDQAFAKELIGGRLDIDRINPWHRFVMSRFVGIRWDRNHLNPVAVIRLAEKVNALVGV